MTLKDINCDPLTYKSLYICFILSKLNQRMADSHSIGIEKLKVAYVDYIWGVVSIFSATWYQAVFTWRSQLDEINDAWALKMWRPQVFRSATPDMNKGNFFLSVKVLPRLFGNVWDRPYCYCWQRKNLWQNETIKKKSYIHWMAKWVFFSLGFKNEVRQFLCKFQMRQRCCKQNAKHTLREQEKFSRARIRFYPLK